MIEQIQLSVSSVVKGVGFNVGIAGFLVLVFHITHKIFDSLIKEKGDQINILLTHYSQQKQQLESLFQKSEQITKINNNHKIILLLLENSKRHTKQIDECTMIMGELEQLIIRQIRHLIEFHDQSYCQIPTKNQPLHRHQLLNQIIRFQTMLKSSEEYSECKAYSHKSVTADGILIKINNLIQLNKLKLSIKKSQQNIAASLNLCGQSIKCHKFNIFMAKLNVKQPPPPQCDNESSIKDIQFLNRILETGITDDNIKEYEQISNQLQQIQSVEMPVLSTQIINTISDITNGSLQTKYEFVISQGPNSEKQQPVKQNINDHLTDDKYKTFIKELDCMIYQGFLTRQQQLQQEQQISDVQHQGQINQAITSQSEIHDIGSSDIED